MSGEDLRTTTVRLPDSLYREAKRLTQGGASLNEVMVAALRAYVSAWKRKRIDAAFAGMADDADFQAEAERVASSFEASDWEALRISERDVQL